MGLGGAGVGGNSRKPGLLRSEIGFWADVCDDGPDYPHGEYDGKNIDDTGKKKRGQDARAQEVRQVGNLLININFL